MKVLGSVMCLPSPAAFASKTLAVVGLGLVGAESLFAVLDLLLNVVHGGMNGFMAAGGGNPMMGGMGGMGGPGGAAFAGQVIVQLLGVACMVGHWFVVGFYTRSVGLSLRNYSLSGTAKGYLLALGGMVGLGLLLILVAVATVGLAGVGFANQMGAMQAGKPQGPGAAGNAAAGGGIILLGLGCIELIVALAALVWYIIMLAQARGAIGLRRGRR
jgi:hypothetical protein